MQKLKTTIMGFALNMCIVPVFAEPIGDWQLICAPQMCELAQAARNEADGETAKITVSPRKQGLFALVAVPLGISLPTGLSLKVDHGAAAVHAFATCTIGGCFAAVPLSGARLEAWRKGKFLHLAFHDGNRQPVRIVFSLVGLTRGLEKLETRQD